MILAQFVLDVLEANAWLYGCEETQQCLLIDAGAADPRIAEHLAKHKLTLAAIFITHGHHDHVDGLATLVQELRPSAVYAPRGTCEHHATLHVGDGDSVRFGRKVGRVVETPGHTADGLSLIFEDVVFTGDALFAGSVGGTSAPADAERQLEALRTHVLPLPDATLVCGGHGPKSTVAIERRTNPFLAPR